MPVAQVGNTPGHLAALKGNRKACIFLIWQGASRSATNAVRGTNPLIFC